MPCPRHLEDPIRLNSRTERNTTMYFLENYRGFGVYLTGSGYVARNRERILTAKTYAEIIQRIHLFTCC